MKHIIKEEYLSGMYQNLPFNQVIVAKDGRIITINQKGKQLLGLGEEETETRFFTEFLGHREKERFLKMLQFVELHKSIEGFELKLDRNLKNVVPIKLYACSFMDEKHNFMGIHCFFQNEKKEKMFVGQLKTELEIFSELFHNLPTCIALRINKEFIMVNTSLKDILKYPETFLIRNFLPNQFQKANMPSLNWIHRNQSILKRFKTESGQSVKAEVLIKKICLSGGRELEIFVFNFDYPNQRLDFDNTPEYVRNKNVHPATF